MLSASRPLPVWRSLLFVPANVRKYVEGAAAAAADAIILDLEDSVPADEKGSARAAVAAAIPIVSACGADVLVRINRPLDLAVRDIEAVVSTRVAALMIPKVDSAAHLRLLAELVLSVELRQGMEAGHTRLYALVETVQAFERLHEIAAADPRMVAITCGGEDLIAELGALPEADVLLAPRQQVVFAARAAGILPLGVLGRTTSFRDLEGLRAGARDGRRFGMAGAPCIHPSQVAILNECFSPTPVELASARRVVDAYDAALATGRGSVALDGRMLDVPVVARAQRLLSVAERIAAAEGLRERQGQQDSAVQARARADCSSP